DDAADLELELRRELGTIDGLLTLGVVLAVAVLGGNDGLDAVALGLALERALQAGDDLLVAVEVDEGVGRVADLDDLPVGKREAVVEGDDGVLGGLHVLVPSRAGVDVLWTGGDPLHVQAGFR